MMDHDTLLTSRSDISTSTGTNQLLGTAVNPQHGLSTPAILYIMNIFPQLNPLPVKIYRPLLRHTLAPNLSMIFVLLVTDGTEPMARQEAAVALSRRGGHKPFRNQVLVPAKHKQADHHMLGHNRSQDHQDLDL